MSKDLKFKLGIFSANCSGGITPSLLDDGWKADWQDNLELAQMADEAGIDFMLPVARFIGFGGQKDFQGKVLETITWASALLARTERIRIFTTLHTPMNHPVIAAKQLATMAQIGGDRIGLNIVAGFYKAECEALGVELSDDHSIRYRYAQEWFDLVKKVWKSDKPFDWNGEFFQCKQVYGKPRLESVPPIFNAAGSKQGREFALKNSDFLFTTVARDLQESKLEIEQLKLQANKVERDIEVLTFIHIICRPTEEEAQAEWKRQLDHEDTDAVEYIMHTLFAYSQAIQPDLIKDLRDRIVTAFGGFPLVGTPEQVANGILNLQAIGFSGAAIAFLDYKKEFAYFRDHVLPLLYQSDN